VTIWK